MLGSMASPAAEPQSELPRLEKAIKRSSSRFLCWDRGDRKATAKEVSAALLLGVHSQLTLLCKASVLAERFLNISITAAV